VVKVIIAVEIVKGSIGRTQCIEGEKAYMLVNIYCLVFLECSGIAVHAVCTDSRSLYRAMAQSHNFGSTKVVQRYWNAVDI